MSMVHIENFSEEVSPLPISLIPYFQKDGRNPTPPKPRAPIVWIELNGQNVTKKILVC
jgi:hypothetical protein